MTEERKSNQKVKVPEFLREPLEMAQARLEALEEEAQRVWKERMQEWKGKAETFRADALAKIVELQSRAVKFLGVATREQVEELSKEIEKVLNRLEGRSTRMRHARRGETDPKA